MSDIKLISNYLRIRQHSSPPYMPVLCQTCPRLTGQPYVKDIEDFRSGQITELPLQTSFDFNSFLRAHSKKDLVLINDGFTVFLKSQKNLKATKYGLYLSYNFKTSDVRLMVIELLKRRIDGVESYGDIPLYTDAIASLLQGVTVKIMIDGWEKLEYIVTGLTKDNAHELLDVVEGQRKSLFSYYKEDVGVIIQYPNIPCLELECISSKEPTLVPFELCYIISPQYSTPSDEVLRKSKETRLSHPANRLIKIVRMASAEFPDSEDLHSFGLQVDPQVTAVAGKVLTPPNLVLGTSKQGLKSIEINELTDKWDYGPLLGSSKTNTVCISKHLKKWVLIHLVHQDLKTFNLKLFA
ncbi:protein argonaute 2 [Tanacetum coccineum]